MPALFTTNDVSTRYEGLPNFIQMMQHYNGTSRQMPFYTPIEHEPFHKSSLPSVQRELRKQLNIYIAGDSSFGDAGTLQFVFTTIDTIDQAGVARKQMQCTKLVVDRDLEFVLSDQPLTIRTAQRVFEHAWSSTWLDASNAQKDESETLATGPNRAAPTTCSVTVHRSVNVASAKRKCDQSQGRNQRRRLDGIWQPATTTGKLREGLVALKETCCVCLDEYTDPAKVVLTSCNHSVCSDCKEGMERSGRTVRCPTCNE
jgi:hypothetical protein